MAFRLFLVVILGWSSAFAEDVTSSLLLEKRGGSDGKSGFESGRYQIKGEGKVKSEPVAEVPPTTEPQIEKPALPKVQKPRPRKQPASQDASAPELYQPKVAEPSLNDQFKSLFDKDSQVGVEKYKDQVHPDDVRLNRMEVEISSGLLQNNSASSYSYRNYNTYSPYFNVGANLWPVPSIGISGRYASTLSADMSATATPGTRVAAKHDFVDLAVEFRKFFGMSRRSNSLTFGLSYSQYNLTVPSTETTRSKLRSQGIGLSLLSRIPVAPSYSWTFGGFIEPRLNHVEQSTGLDLRSGSSPQSSRFGLEFGGEIKMSRHDQLIWSLDYKVERDQFGESSNIVDPETGSLGRGVSVTNSFLLFTFGYRWGR